MIPYIERNFDNKPKYLIDTYSGETLARVLTNGYTSPVYGGTTASSPEPTSFQIYGDSAKIGIHPILKLVSDDGEFLFYVDVQIYGGSPGILNGHLNVLDNFEVMSRLKAFSPENQKVKFK